MNSSSQNPIQDKEARSCVGRNTLIRVGGECSDPLFLLDRSNCPGYLDRSPEKTGVWRPKRPIDNVSYLDGKSGIGVLEFGNVSLKMFKTYVSCGFPPRLTPRERRTVRAVEQKPHPNSFSRISAQSGHLRVQFRVQRFSIAPVTSAEHGG